MSGNGEGPQIQSTSPAAFRHYKNFAEYYKKVGEIYYYLAGTNNGGISLSAFDGGGGGGYSAFIFLIYRPYSFHISPYLLDF